MLKLGAKDALLSPIGGGTELDGEIIIRGGFNPGDATGAEVHAVAYGKLGAAGSPTIHKGGAFTDHPKVELPAIGGELAET